MTKQTGFTLVELTMVLIIISLLLGGTLKGRELIFNSKIHRCQDDFKTIAGAIYGYSNRYHALPGDDSKADRWTGATKGDGDGQIEGDWNSTTATDETRLAWQHLRMANLLTGKNTDAATHSFDGNIGIDQGLMSIVGTMVCMNNIPADAAEIIDSNMDDGQRNEGSVRADTNPVLSSKPTAATYTAGNLYTVCYQI